MSEQPDMTRTFQAIVDALCQGMKRMVEGALPLLAEVGRVMWDAYRQAGMPYGDTQEGLMHWIRDLGEIKRHEMEIERIKQHHDTLIVGRKIGEAIRAERKEAREPGV